EALLDNTDKAFIMHTELDNRVGVLKLFPGISPAFVQSILDADVRSIVMETFGSGNTMTDEWFLDMLEDTVKKGKNIVDISQCKVGSVELGRYETSQGLKALGVLNGYDMTFEAAVTKLMYLQGQLTDQEAVAYWVEKNIRGELTVND